MGEVDKVEGGGWILFVAHLVDNRIAQSKIQTPHRPEN